jgi:hypothetical protein
MAIVLVASTLAGGSAYTASPSQRQLVLADALHAMRARGDLAHLADSGRRAVIATASQESQWKGYVAASVYAARGNPLHSVKFVRPKPLGGDVTLGFPAVNCACSFPHMHRLGRLRPASRLQVVRAIYAAAKRVGAQIDRIELLHPLAYAPIITVTVGDPRRFVRSDLEARLGIPLLGKVEGFWVTVRGPRGRVFASGGISVRSYDVFGNGGWMIPV